MVGWPGPSDMTPLGRQRQPMSRKSRAASASSSALPSSLPSFLAGSFLSPSPSFLPPLPPCRRLQGRVGVAASAGLARRTARRGAPGIARRGAREGSGRAGSSWPRPAPSPLRPRERKEGARRAPSWKRESERRRQQRIDRESGLPACQVTPVPGTDSAP